MAVKGVLVGRLVGRCHAGRGQRDRVGPPQGGHLPELPSMKTEQCIFTLEITRESLDLKNFWK